jgi:replicative DNA helicase
MATSYPDKDITTIHTPPNSKEAEDSIIGSLLMDNSVFDVLGDVIGEEDFYSTPNRLIYQAIRSLINDGKAADVLTVYDYLSEKGQSLETGGISQQPCGIYAERGQRQAVC